MSMSNYITGIKFLIAKSLDLAHSIRLITWFFLSKKNYTSAAFVKNSQTFKKFDDNSCSGYSYMVTGATGSIGKATCEYLVQKENVKVYAICYDKKRSDELEENLRLKCHPTSKFEIHMVNLSETKEVVDFLSKFVAEKKSLNVVIYAAGYYSEVEQRNSYGAAKMFVVNTLSAYLFMTRLSEYMDKNKSEDKINKIIYCTCGIILTVNARPYDPELKKLPFKPLFDFSHQKKQITQLVADYFPKKYHSVHFSSVNPGWVNTDEIFSAKNKVAKFRVDCRTPEQGADTILWLAISDEALHFPSGQYFLDRKPEKPSYFTLPVSISEFVLPTYLEYFEKNVQDHLIKSGCIDAVPSPPSENNSVDKPKS